MRASHTRATTRAGMTDIGSIVLRLENLTRYYGGIRAVQDVSLTVSKGERLGLIGPNGAGKTTLVRLISGEVQPTEGRILIGRKDVTSLSQARRARHGLARTFQITELFSDLTVTENLFLAAANRTRRAAVASVVKKAAEQTGISDVLTERISNLGYGRQRQVELAMALAQGPELMLLDEPAAGLDAKDRDRVVDVMSSLSGELTVILIEHDVDLVVRLCNRVVCLAQGRVIADSTPEEIIRDPRVRDLYLGGGKAEL